MALAAGLASLALSACATGGQAPIVYAVRAPALIALPPPLDLARIPFAEANAPVVIRDRPYSECVPFARTTSGIQIWGDAVTWWTQAASLYVRSGRPAEGSVMVLKGWNDAARGHVSAVREVVSPRMVRVDHANWLRNGEISLNVPVMDVSDANDWSKVRVWNVPGGNWGVRVYDVQGFIHPYRLDGGAFGG